MRDSRDPKELLDAWTGWHSISPPMRADYARFVELANEGARELGFKDTGAIWRAKYDMPPDAFAAEIDRLWGQVKPLYDSLHCYVRARLNKKYGDAKVPPDKPDPRPPARQHVGAGVGQHLRPGGAAQAPGPGYDLTKRARRSKKVDAEGDGRSTARASSPRSASRRSRTPSGSARCSPSRATATSSATPAPGTSTTRTTCASRCASSSTTRTSVTIHHELGHNYYQRAYNNLPFLFQDGANDGFHEAIGDTIALSITPGVPEADRAARQACRTRRRTSAC